jgi:hypothetical protein
MEPVDGLPLWRTGGVAGGGARSQNWRAIVAVVCHFLRRCLAVAPKASNWKQ